MAVVKLPPPPHINVLHLFIHLFNALLTFALNVLSTDVKRPLQGRQRNIQMLSSYVKPEYPMFNLGFQLKRKRRKNLKLRIQNTLALSAKLTAETLA